MAEAIAQTTPGEMIWKPGRTMKSTPMKPMTTALQRQMPTFSPKANGAAAVTKNGKMKKIASVSASGRKGSAAK